MKISEKFRNDFYFYYDGITLDFNDISTLFEKNIWNQKTITVLKKENNFSVVVRGKKLKVSIMNQDGETYIGTLNQIKELFYILKNNFYPNKNIDSVTIKEKKIMKDDERTFSSIGIRNDFICNINFNKNDKPKDSNLNQKNKIKDSNCIIL